MGKRSFVLHLDSLEILSDMPDEFAGRLFKIITNYNSTGEVPEMDFAMRMAAMPFIKQFERDAEKYQEKVEANRLNGSMGGRPKKSEETQPNPENPTAFSESEPNPENPDEPKKGDSDSDNESDNESIARLKALEGFDTFYNLYGKKVDLKAAKSAWARLSKAKKTRAMEAVVSYVARTPDIKFRRSPARWLNAESWNDEPIPEPQPNLTFNPNLHI